MSRPKEHRVKKTLKRRLIREQGGVCAACGCRGTTSTLEPHHIIPVSRGGATEWGNLTALCRACHVARHQIIS